MGRVIEQETQLLAVLRRAKRSLTKPRLTVFQALQQPEPLPMRQLIAKCGAIDRASVYRTIALFEQLGIVQRLTIGWKYKLELSDRFQAHHHHLICKTCGAIISLPEDKTLEYWVQRVTGSYHYSLLSHQLEIRGLCPNCK